MTIDPTHYRQLFFAEAAEHLASLEGVLMQLEADPSNREAVAVAFRLAHTVKGAADAVGFPEIATFTHRIEEVLGRLRDVPNEVPASMLDVLLQATDHLGALVKAAQNGESSPAGTEAILAKLAGDVLDSNRPAPVVGHSIPGIFVVSVRPAAETLKCGVDPLRRIRELSDLGRIHSVQLNKARLPSLEELNPDQCYLDWTIRIETEQAPEALREVFAFAAHVLDVQIEREAATQDPPEPEPDPTSRLDPLWFGCFLCDQGVLTQDQLTKALGHARNSRPRIGEIATHSKLLSAEQTQAILVQQQPGELFGDTAVRMGALSELDLWDLLLEQQGSISLETALLELELITPSRLADEAAAFGRYMELLAQPTAGPSEAGFTVVPVLAALDYEVLVENAEMISEFCTEADDHLLAADRHLLELHADPANKRAIDAIYRGFHTIKGVSSMLGLKAVQGLAHEAENLLNLARDGKVVLSGRPLDMAFAATDGLKRQFEFVRSWLQLRGSMEQDPLLGQLLADLVSTTTGKPACSQPASSIPASAPPAIPAPAAVSNSAPVVAIPRESVVDSPNRVAPTTAAVATPAPTAVAPPPAAPQVDANAPARRPATAEKETVRVDRDRLDKLVNTIGELVIAQSMAEEEVSSLMRQAGGQLRAMAELTKISRSLQELGLSLRMVPMSGVFQKMSRLVRDLSRKMEKPVELVLHGEETELDKSVVDHLGDPLMHMVRNAIDHGLESVEERLAAGKPATGHVSLNAYHQGGSILIELSDDGKGLDREKLLKKAIEKGIITENQRLSDSEVYALIFEAGFSTAKAVTDVSGRGVGMDVVRRNVEELHGNILIRTELGKGTTFTIRLPLTLAIMDGLMVALGDDVYLLPMLSVVESIRPKRSDLHTLAGRGEVVSARGETIPLLRLHALLGRPVRVTDPCKGLVVLVEDQGKKYALLVDDLLGQMQAVVKSLDSNYRRVEGLTGATILGDGRVAMILDVHGLTKLQGQLGGHWRPSPRSMSEFAELSGDR